MTMNRYGFALKRSQDEYTGKTWIAFVNTKSDDLAKMATEYNAQDISYFRSLVRIQARFSGLLLMSYGLFAGQKDCQIRTTICYRPQGCHQCGQRGERHAGTFHYSRPGIAKEFRGTRSVRHTFEAVLTELRIHGDRLARCIPLEGIGHAAHHVSAIRPLPHGTGALPT